ncbi:MAG: DUF1684 domain-containing protein [Saprospiraceae bacterium]|nr:DUF1684 domain-containing protein [Saprospiraceae bacterium]
MTRKISLEYALALLLVISACQVSKVESTSAEYLNEIRQWHHQRIERLKAPDGWLSLVGLYWIRQGEQTFGSANDRDIRFPINAPANIGTIALAGDSVMMQVVDDLPVTIDNEIVSNQLIYKTGIEAPLLGLDDLTWHIMKRGDRYALRLKDQSSPLIAAMDSIPRYPISSEWKIRAKFSPADSADTILLDDVQGMKRPYQPAGSLRFQVDSKSYEVTVLNSGEERYFLIFGDETNGVETYGGGRYLYPNMADKDGMTYIDFNKAFNPPCAFTDFATCLLPPPQNKIPVLVEAGEMNYGDH